MKKLLFGLPILLLISCGGGGGGGGTNPPPPVVVKITISPTSASVTTDEKQQFTATVTGTANTAVTWQVNSVTGGNSTVGTISSTGLYTAPTIAPNPATVTVTAIAQADTSKTASATVTVVNVVAVHISPSSLMIISNGTQQFTTTVTGTTNTAVTWQVNGNPGGNSTVGTITAAGLYTAPATVPTPATVTVAAVSQADAAKSSSAAVTIASSYSNGFLSGSYAFILSGTDKTSGFFFAAGSFTTDGNGNFQNGVQDYSSGSFGIVQSLPFTGTYDIGSDGRGTATMTYQVTINSVLTTITSDFRLIVESDSRIRFIGFDNNSASSGLMLKRDSSAFSTLNGNYAFGFNGGNSNGNPVLSTAGEFHADGAGNVTNGLEDINDSGTVSSSITFTGTYALNASTGRGTLTVTDSDSQTSHFAFYIVDQNTLFVVETDYLPALSGMARLQQATSFSNSSLTGDYAFSLDTPVGNGSVVVAGRFTSSASGVISGGDFSSNVSGAVHTNAALNGTYSVAATGRGTVVLTTPFGQVNLAVYLVSPQEAFAVQTDSGNLSSGTILAQQGGPFGLSSVSGSFGFNAFVENTYANQIGRVSANGAGSFTSGTLDSNSTTSQTAGETLTSGSYTVASSGSGTASISTSTGTESYIIYLVSPSKAFVIDTDSQKEALGNLEKQF